MISGMYEYNIRNFYVNYIRNNNKLSSKEEKVLDDNFKNTFINASSIYTNYEDELMELCLNEADYILSIQ